MARDEKWRFDGRTTSWLEDVEEQSLPRVRRGGQHAGVSSGVMVVHKPTGIAVIRESERSMMKNRENAREQLRSILDILHPWDYTEEVKETSESRPCSSGSYSCGYEKGLCDECFRWDAEMRRG